MFKLTQNVPFVVYHPEIVVPYRNLNRAAVMSLIVGMVKQNLKQLPCRFGLISNEMSMDALPVLDPLLYDITLVAGYVSVALSNIGVPSVLVCMKSSNCALVFRHGSTMQRV